MQTEDVTTCIVVDDGGCTGNGRRTVLTLGWRQSDPLAVHIALSPEPDHPSLPRGDWSLLRDFLRYGLHAATGDGCVRMRPHDDRLTLELWDGGRKQFATVCALTVQQFLDATERIVPSGTEASDGILDELIDRLLRA